MIPKDDEGHGFVIKPKTIPKQYIFYLTLKGLTDNDADVPTVTKFAMNNVVLCDDSIKVRNIHHRYYKIDKLFLQISPLFQYT